MNLPLKAVITFTVVAQERSFTRAAERMGLTQPWVSEQVRQLESYLGFPLFTRSTRHLDLTPEGVTLMVYGKRMLELREEAEGWIQRVKGQDAQKLAIGTIPPTANISARSELIDEFTSTYERVQVEIFEDEVPNLLDRLRKRELDVLILFDRGYFGQQDLEVMALADFEAYLLVPIEDPIAKLRVLPISVLAGHSIVTTPVRVDPYLVGSLKILFTGRNVTLISAPESNRSGVERFARNKRLGVFRWRAPGLSARQLGDMMQIPLEEKIMLKLVLLRNKDFSSRNGDRFWRMAGEMLSRQSMPLISEAV